MRGARTVFAPVVLGLLCALLIASVMPGPAMAEEATDTSDPPAVARSEVPKTPFEGFSKQSVNARIDEIQKEIDSIVSEKDILIEERLAEEEDIRRALISLGSLQNVYSRYLTVIDRLEEARNGEEELPRKTEGVAPGKPGYNLSYYEDVLNRFETAVHKLDSTTSSIRLSESNLVSLKEHEQRLTERYRELLKAPEPSSGPERLRRSLHITEADADLEAAQVSREAQSISIETQRILQARAQAERDELAKELAHVEENLVFDEKDRDDRLQSIGERMAQAREKLPALRDEREKARLALSRKQGALTSARSDKERQLAQAAVAEQQVALQLAQVVLEQAEQEVQFLEEEQRIWGLRYMLIEGSLKGQEIWDMRAEAQARQKNLENVIMVRQRSASSIQAEIVSAQKELEESENLSVAARIRSRLNLLHRTAEAANATMAMVFPVISQYNRLEEEINDRIDAVNIAERVTAFGKERFLAFWNITLWSGEGFDITVWKLSLAVALFLGAFLLSGRLTEALSRMLFARFGMDNMARMAGKKILFFLLMGAFILVALDLVGIPLTAFAFLGGALAIGIGFGAQDFFNNLISGFIIMFSMPIRVDDIIEIDGQFATVEEIGSRATRIKTFDNIDVLMPNSYFLNNKIVNWTLTDKRIRTMVKVGVAHGSDVRKVEELLLLAATDHTRVLKNPEPFVVFGDIGTNALEFTLYLWIDMGNASGMKVCSDIRFRLVSLFEKQGIKIAPPRMYVWLDRPKQAELDHGESEEATPKEV
ncbi:MAG: mechanosensitive ion channel [Synergistaceae bacterium]|nr:mechanosensitive ion channel [Synergistota bacterium]NLM71751.1 mechanosensitive ion channel [Synergistaceae bacterium]